jgi:hypothetical protein
VQSTGCIEVIIIIIHCILGEFGIVYKGYIMKEQGNIVTDTVAVKTLKGIDMHASVHGL